MQFPDDMPVRDPASMVENDDVGLEGVAGRQS